jgi:hypothetical protein
MINIKSLFIALGLGITMITYQPASANSVTVGNPSPQKSIEELAKERSVKIVNYLSLTEAQADKVYEVNLHAAKKAQNLEKSYKKNKQARQREARLLRQEMEKSYKSIFTAGQYKKHLKKQQAVESAYQKQLNKSKRS